MTTGKDQFTPRELDVLDALIDGTGTDRDIAERLGMSPTTAALHVANIRRKTGHETRTSLAVSWAIRKTLAVRLDDRLISFPQNASWSIGDTTVTVQVEKGA